MRASGIYEIKNTITGKSYIGSGLDCGRRWWMHRSMLNLGKHHSRKLQGSWNKHGEAAFEFLVVELVEQPKDLLSREQFWIDERDSFVNGYNSRPDARSNLGVKHRPESIEKVRAAKTGLKMLPHVKALLLAANKGRPLSEEHRRLVGLAGVGRVKSDATREKLREATARSWQAGVYDRAGTFGGRKHSEESKKLMSESRSGIRPREHARRKLDMDKARAMRAMREAGSTYTEIGEKFGVSGVAARFVCIGKIWREDAVLHVPAPRRQKAKRAA